MSDPSSASHLGVYTTPSDGEHSDFLEHISELPRDAPPYVFGMNSNASINKDQAETNKLFAAVLLTQVINDLFSLSLFFIYYKGS